MLKISDFNSALVHGPFNAISTLYYMAPEAALKINRAQGPAMDMWAAGLIVAEIFAWAKPVFEGIQNTTHLVNYICQCIGSPTIENDMMPSYFGSDEIASKCIGHRVPRPGAGMYPQCTAADCFFSGLPVWVAEFFNNTICWEPTRRVTASWALKRFMIAPTTAVPLDTHVNIINAHTTLVDRMHVYSKTVQNTGVGPSNDRVVCSMWLHMLGVWYGYDHETFRRVFHTAVTILDRLLADQDFVDTHFRPIGEEYSFQDRKTRISGVCMAIYSIASKMCDSVTYFVAESSMACLGPVASVACVRPPTGCLMHAPAPVVVYEIERDIVALMDWDFYNVTPMDFEAVVNAEAAFTSVKRSAYQYFMDLIAYLGSATTSGTNTPLDVSKAAMWCALRATGTPQSLPDKITKALILETQRIACKFSTASVYTYYATPDKHNVVTYCGMADIVRPLMGCGIPQRLSSHGSVGTQTGMAAPRQCKPAGLLMHLGPMAKVPSRIRVVGAGVCCSHAFAGAKVPTGKTVSTSDVDAQLL